jgi:hypothetical protein
MKTKTKKQIRNIGLAILILALIKFSWLIALLASILIYFVVKGHDNKTNRKRGK